MVRKYPSSMICANEAACDVRSQPSEQCSNTEAEAVSIRSAIRAAANKVNLKFYLKKRQLYPIYFETIHETHTLCAAAIASHQGRHTISRIYSSKGRFVFSSVSLSLRVCCPHRRIITR